MSNSKRTKKAQLVQRLGQRIAKVAIEGRLTRSAKPQPVTIERMRGIVGPRAGAVELGAGLESGKLLRALSRDDCATFRNLLTWDFAGDPVVYMAGAMVRCEAGWPGRLADTMIRLREAQERPGEPWRWLAGKDEAGGTIRPGLYDATSNWLLAGTTGSGKSLAIRSAILQLANGHNSIAMIDGKYGEGLRPVSRLPGVVGPVATELPQAKAVLTWACAQMRQRYENGNGDGKVVVCVDEIQEFTRDAGFVGLLAKLASQGRAAGVHLILSTQHPALEIFGDVTTRRNVSGRVALKTADYEASKVATGSTTIRADLLLGAGDAYVCTPAATHRAQLFYIDDDDIAKVGAGAWEIQNWLDLDIEPQDIGQELPTPKRGVKKCFTPEQVGASLIAAINGDGRPTFEKWLDEHGITKPGGHGPYRLHKFGQALAVWLGQHDYQLSGM